MWRATRQNSIALVLALVLTGSTAFYWPRAPRYVLREDDSTPCPVTVFPAPPLDAGGTENSAYKSGFTVDDRTPCTILSTSRWFTQVQIANGRTGWVFNEWVRRK